MRWFDSTLPLSVIQVIAVSAEISIVCFEVSWKTTLVEIKRHCDSNSQWVASGTLEVCADASA